MTSEQAKEIISEKPSDFSRAMRQYQEFFFSKKAMEQFSEEWNSFCYQNGDRYDE